MLDGILAVTADLTPRFNLLPLLIAVDVPTRESVQAAWDHWSARLIEAEFSDEPRAAD